MNVGIIAEDDSDVAVISLLTLGLLNPYPVGFKKFVGDGCGKLRRKCAVWSLNLVSRGCSWIIVLHDLDEYDETQLRASLMASIASCGAKASIVLIPKREIEAWLLYDAVAIATAFRERVSPTLPTDPESIPDPKKYLGEIVWKKYRKPYLNTLHNARIAENIRVTLLGKSRSFLPHIGFVAEMRNAVQRRSR